MLTSYNAAINIKTAEASAHAGGDLHWVKQRGRGVDDAKGSLLYLDGVIVDVTEQKQIELEVQRQNAILQNSHKR